MHTLCANRRKGTVAGTWSGMGAEDRWMCAHIRKRGLIETYLRARFASVLCIAACYFENVFRQRSHDV
jgi:hypothetical protein